MPTSKSGASSAATRYFNFRYGWELRYTLAGFVYPDIVGFWRSHFSQPYLKRTFETVWSQEHAALDATCRHRLRSAEDVGDWVMRYCRHYFAMGRT